MLALASTIAMTATVPYATAQAAQPLNAQVDAAGIMPKLAGRIWGNNITKAMVELEPDGRYRVRIALDVHRI